MIILTLFRLLFVVLTTAFTSALSRLRRGPPDATWSWTMTMLCAMTHDALAWLIRLPRPLHRRLERLASPLPMPRRFRRALRLEPIALGGIPGERYVHAEGRPATLLYLHGGGYIGCTLGTYRALTTWYAYRTRVSTYAIEYRLAPEHPFPAALEDALAAYQALLDDGVDPSSLVLAGDSAGAGLSLALMLSARDRGLPLPAGAVCMCPYVDLTLPGASVNENAGSDILPIAKGHEVIGWYAGSVDPSHPLVSPTYADLRGLPPLLVFAGGREIFRDDIRVFVERARRAGLSVEFHEYEHMFHVWPLIMPWHPASRHAMDLIAGFADRCLTRAQRDERVGAPVAAEVA